MYVACVSHSVIGRHLQNPEILLFGSQVENVYSSQAFVDGGGGEQTFTTSNM